MSLFDVLVVIFATWRITSVINREVFGWPLRKAIGATVDSAGLESFPATIPGYLISCFKCLSMWVGCLVVIMWVIEPVLVYPFALSAAVILLERYI